MTPDEHKRLQLVREISPTVSNWFENKMRIGWSFDKCARMIVQIGDIVRPAPTKRPERVFRLNDRTFERGDTVQFPNQVTRHFAYVCVDGTDRFATQEPGENPKLWNIGEIPGASFAEIWP